MQFVDANKDFVRVLMAWNELARCSPVREMSLAMISRKQHDRVLSCINQTCAALWIETFGDMVFLRGLMKFGRVSLSRLCTDIKGVPYIERIRGGEYDSWTSTGSNTLSLDHILSGQKPGDWLEPPTDVDSDVDETSARLYAARALADEPHIGNFMSLARRSLDPQLVYPKMHNLTKYMR